MPAAISRLFPRMTITMTGLTTMKSMNIIMIIPTATRTIFRVLPAPPLW